MVPTPWTGLLKPRYARRAELYDAHNNVTQTTDRNLRVRQFTYDELDRQRKEIWLSGATPVHTVTMDFDLPGRLTVVGDPKATYTYQFDELNRRTVVANAASTGIPLVTLTQGFDARDRRTTLTVTRQGVNDFRNTYTYDALGRLTGLTQDQQAGGASVAYKRVDLAYNKLDQLVTVSRYRGSAATPNLVATSEYFSYDDLNRLRGLGHKQGATVFATYSWDFDTGDRLTTVNYQYGSASYTYDATDQLTRGTHSYLPAAEVYTYDANGNRTGAFQAGAGNRLATYTSGTSVWTYLYDGEGNRTERNLKVSGSQQEHVKYEWDYRNRLTRVYVFSGAGLPLAQDIAYTYDAFNRRIAKVVYDVNQATTTTTQYAYEGDNIAFVFDGAGSAAGLSTRYLTGPGMDEVFADEEGGEPRWPLTDQVGTVRELVKWVSGTPAVVKALRYDAFGNRTDQNPGVQYAYSYTGRELDGETGLYYYRARYYDAAVGTFVSEDPKGFGANDPNFYRYVGNYPTDAADPTGLQGVPSPLQGWFLRKAVDWGLAAGSAVGVMKDAARPMLAANVIIGDVVRQRITDQQQQLTNSALLVPNPTDYPQMVHALERLSGERPLQSRRADLGGQLAQMYDTRHTLIPNMLLDILKAAPAGFSAANDMALKVLDGQSMEAAKGGGAFVAGLVEENTIVTQLVQAKQLQTNFAAFVTEKVTGNQIDDVTVHFVEDVLSRMEPGSAIAFQRNVHSLGEWLDPANRARGADTAPAVNFAIDVASSLVNPGVAAHLAVRGAQRLQGAAGKLLRPLKVIRNLRIESGGISATWGVPNVRIRYVSNAPQGDWVRPKGWRLPKNGTWEGTPGHSNFKPTNPAELGLKPGEVVPFRNGRPDFSNWSKGNFASKEALIGEWNADAPKMIKALAEQKGWTQQQVKDWLTKERLSLHHSGGNNFQLIPWELHGNPSAVPPINGIRHMGSAFDLRNP